MLSGKCFKGIKSIRSGHLSFLPGTRGTFVSEINSLKFSRCSSTILAAFITLYVGHRVRLTHPTLSFSSPGHILDQSRRLYSVSVKYNLSSVRLRSHLIILFFIHFSFPRTGLSPLFLTTLLHNLSVSLSIYLFLSPPRFLHV